MEWTLDFGLCYLLPAPAGIGSSDTHLSTRGSPDSNSFHPTYITLESESGISAI